jgi:hypothetical protein
MNYFREIDPCCNHHQVFVRPDVTLDQQLKKLLKKRDNYGNPLFNKLCSLIYEDSPFQVFRQESDVLVKIYVEYQEVNTYITAGKLTNVEVKYISNL